MSEAPLRRIESHLAGARGPRLFRRAWLPERPEHVLAVVHGYAEHSGRYEALARWFGERGFAVHAYDQRGHGRSSGRRGHAESFEVLLDDLDAFLEHVREAHPELPLTLLGHSLGGLVALAFLAERRPRLASAVASGPALAIGESVSGVRRAVARALGRVAPRLALPSGLDARGISRDPQVVEAYLADPLVFRTTTSRLAVALFDGAARTAAAAGAVEVPLLLVHGEADPLCPVEASRRFHAELRAPGSALRVYPELYHEVFNEPERETVLEDVRAWVRGELP